MSGGAYTAGAWSIARGRSGEASDIVPQASASRDGLFDKDQPGETPNRFEYIKTFRRYLATGRGGLSAAVLTVILCLLFHCSVLFVMLYLVSYPLRWLTSTWAIVPQLRDFDYIGVFEQTASLPLHLWLPGCALLAAGFVAWLLSLFLWGSSQRTAMKTAAGLFAAGIALLALLIALPWMVTNGTQLMTVLAQQLPGKRETAAGGGGFLAVMSGLGLTGALVRLATKPLAQRASKLGGILLALLALILGGKIATDASYGTGFFGSAGAYLWVFAIFSLFYFAANPQLWSLHVLYHARLRTTFATTQNPSKRVAGAPSEAGVYPISYRAEPPWPDYQGRDGPELVVCASVQTKGNLVTEIPALSFTFSAREIGYHAIGWNPDHARSEIKSYVVPAEDYVDILTEHSALRKWTLGCVSAAMAMSGAAFTSAMGRHSLGTTNSLLAVLNLRLGVWMPNPAYVSGSSPQTFFKKQRINYLVKEIVGAYDLGDPYIYVTDGGHWENLGFVELVRRRAKVIFCIDASGDAPDSFTTLRQAITLARLECNVEVEIDLRPLKAAPDAELPEEAVAVGVVRYHTGSCQGSDSCPIGVLFYAKATIGRKAPVSVLSFGLRDRIFPRYPTFDQFLDEAQFENLVDLGRWAGTESAALYKALAETLRGTLGEEPDAIQIAASAIRAWERRTGREWYTQDD